MEVEEEDKEAEEEEEEEDDEKSRPLSSFPGPCLFAVVSDGRQDGAQCLHAHGNVQQVAGVEEVVVMAQ